MHGMANEATQGPGGWGRQGVMERIHNGTRPEVAPGMHGTLDRARATLSVEEFVKDVDLEVSSDDNGEAGLSRSQKSSFAVLPISPPPTTPFSQCGPASAPQFHETGVAFGRRVCGLRISDVQKRAGLSWGTEHRDLW